MKGQTQKEAETPPETGISASLHFFLPLVVLTGFSFAFAQMPTLLMAALFYLAICVVVIVAITHHTKS